MSVTAPSDTDPDHGDKQDRDPWAELGLPRTPFLDDRLAPDVDREFLRKLVRDELPEPAASAACRLIIAFRSWSEAHKQILAEERRGPMRN